jgi:hypothetical protein
MTTNGIEELFNNEYFIGELEWERIGFNYQEKDKLRARDQVAPHNLVVNHSGTAGTTEEH